LKEEGTDEAISKIENVDELINVMMGLEQGEEKVSLETFLDKVSLVTDVDLYEDKGNRVSLMTLHCAKGLEFPMVFIVGLEEGLLPHYRRGEEIEDMEEERRLFYVGMTRAKERLFLSRAEERSTFGVGRANLPSRFLDELPVELMQFEEKKGRMESLFSQEAHWREDARQTEMMPEDLSQEISFAEEGGLVLSPEGFFPLKIGMRVRHPKFGEGRVKSVEGMDENQKATVVFQNVGAKRLKVRYANLEILES
jgi:DNA helicase-2/ATP-dependent DNA helicase PcrA